MGIEDQLSRVLRKLDRLQADMDNSLAHSHKQGKCWVCGRLLGSEPHDLTAHKLWQGTNRPAGAAEVREGGS